MIGKRLVRGLQALLGSDGVLYRDVVLPAPHLRFCGPEFKDDQYFFESATREADRLVRHCGLSKASRILDVGCGPGRLPLGILSTIGGVQSYKGFDVDAQSVRWGKRNISRKYPFFEFAHLDVQNARYNPRGRVLDENFRFPCGKEEFDIIYLYSVFSHMTEEQVRIYVKEFRRVLASCGKIFLTGFVEPDVSEMAINPERYRMTWRGPLHCVRYNKDFLVSILEDNGFRLDRFDYSTETDGQSAIYASGANP